MSIIKSAIKRAASHVAAILVRLRLLPNIVVLNMDGGICSQMHFYMAGRMLELQGCKVLYNLDWYANDGMDTQGRFCRNFDLLKAFPYLDMPVLKSKFIKRIYRLAFRHYNEYSDFADDTQWRGLKPPIYIKGYFKETDGMFGQEFHNAFKVVGDTLDKSNLQKFNDIDEKARTRGACAIHVRRGDLSQYHEAYGTPAAIDYFRQSCKLVAEASPNVKFYIFSDEPDWCAKNLVPALADYDIEICGDNGSDKGWCDLLLMSRCNHQITSQGSMGRYAAKLRPLDRCKGIVTLTDNPELAVWTPRFENVIIVKNTHKNS